MNGTRLSESPPRRGLGAALALALALLIPALPASAGGILPLAASEQAAFDSAHAAGAVTAEALLALACPQNRDRWSHLEAGRVVNDRLALAAAIRRAAALRDGTTTPLRERTARYKRPTSARQVVATVHSEYGPNSLLSRGVDALATIAIAAEDTTQVPLDRLNSITGTIFEASSRALGIDAAPRLKLRSRISADKAGVTLSTNW